MRRELEDGLAQLGQEWRERNEHQRVVEKRKKVSSPTLQHRQEQFYVGVLL